MQACRLLNETTQDRHQLSAPDAANALVTLQTAEEQELVAHT